MPPTSSSGATRVWQPDSSHTMPEIVVCIATYRRPADLKRLLNSLTAQKGLESPFGIAVVDNDPDGSAGEVVDSVEHSAISICYAIEPEPGIPVARNRSLELARDMGARYVAFIDDDEVATPRWLERMHRRMIDSGADAVSGPVDPVFPESTPAWAIESGLFKRARYSAGEDLEYASTANSMLRLAAIDGVAEPFVTAFRYTGGSDTYLYRSLRDRGGRIGWEPEGLVYEYVPARRISMWWLVTRSYRHGITLARCDRLIYGLSWRTAIRGLRGLAQIPAGFLIGLAGLTRRRVYWRRGLVRSARGLGVVAGLAGFTYEEYRRPG